MWTTTLLRASTRSSLLLSSSSSSLSHSIRSISTLPSNPHIYIHPNPQSPTSHILSLLPTSPPNTHLSIGTTSSLPPTPSSLTENPYFLTILHSVLAKHATADPAVRSQAMAFASSSGSTLGSGGVFFPGQRGKKQKVPRLGGGGGAGGGGAGGASGQGGAGGAGRGGWVHVSDERMAVDFGRIAWPEDIFGSVEVDGRGEFVKGEDGKEGNFMWSGTYRVVTREGILGLSDFLRGKLVERLQEEERKEAK